MFRISGLMTLAFLCAPAGAAKLPEANPAAYVEAFNETCRTSFPDLDAIAKVAVAHGWIKRGVASVAMIGNRRIDLPDAFEKDGMTLFLTHGGSSAFMAVCQVTGSADTRLAGRDIAAIIGPGLNAGEPEPGSGNYDKNDLATWTLANGVTVQAGVNVYKGKTRTISIAMRQAPMPSAVSNAAPPARPSKDISMVAIGLPFTPETPTPVRPTHPLFHDVAIEDIRDLPATVKSSSFNFVAAAKRSSVNAALSETFRQMNLLAPPPALGRKRLVVTWLGEKTPFHIGVSNATSVTLRYRLERSDTGQALFEREITTSARGGGMNASMRDNGTVRAAIAANFASAANCLDHAAFGPAPADCALTPQFGVSVVRIGR